MEKNLGDLFQEWQNLNSQVADSLGEFEFASLKEARKKQSKIEDEIYSILLEIAPDDIKGILPKTCGEMEIGYEISKNIFYFLMEDPEHEEEEDLIILAITIDSNKNVITIKNFKPEDAN